MEALNQYCRIHFGKISRQKALLNGGCVYVFVWVCYVCAVYVGEWECVCVFVCVYLGRGLLSEPVGDSPLEVLILQERPAPSISCS